MDNKMFHVQCACAILQVFSGPCAIAGCASATVQPLRLHNTRNFWGYFLLLSAHYHIHVVLTPG